MMSKPMDASSNPNATIMTALSGDPPPTPTSVANDRTNTANSSAGPKRSAKSASTLAKNVSRSVAISAPTKEATKEEVNARPGRPRCLANGKPSNSSTTDHGSPGMLNSMEVMTPPNSAPQ